MATRKKTNGKKAETAITNWDAEFAKAAEEASDQEAGGGGGTFFSIRNGKLSYGGGELPGSEMVCVVLDSIHENVYYEGSFDPDAPAGPVCFAFGRHDDEMKPHAQATKAQEVLCEGCGNNEFGSAERGKGKACRNRRRLACVSAGVIDKDGGFTPFDSSLEIEKGEVGYLAVPPTSINVWAAYVKQVKAIYKRPPWAVLTRIIVEPDPKKQVKITFECEGPVPSDWNAHVKARHKEASEIIEFPYAGPSAEKSAPKGRGRKTTTKKTTTRRNARF